MLKLGTIGTGDITHQFVKAAHSTKQYQLTTVYSRTIQTAQTFASHYTDVQCSTDIADFLASSIDIVYIASPNSLHFPQAKAAILANKHVIMEKPAVSCPEEWAELVTLAQEQHVYIFEAARNYHEQAFDVISDFLKNKTILGAHFTYAKYSSKMPALLAGQEPNVFSAKFSGGALMDLGIYPIYAAVRLFGAPASAYYTAQQLPNTIDLNGIGSLIYPEFQVTIQTGKNINSFFPAEIYTTDGTLTLNSIEFITSAVFQDLNKEKKTLEITRSSHTMAEEAKQFAQVLSGEIKQETYQNWLDAATTVHKILFSMRQDAGIRFEADHDNN